MRLCPLSTRPIEYLAAYPHPQRQVYELIRRAPGHGLADKYANHAVRSDRPVARLLLPQRPHREIVPLAGVRHRCVDDARARTHTAISGYRAQLKASRELRIAHFPRAPAVPEDYRGQNWRT